MTSLPRALLLTLLVTVSLGARPADVPLEIVELAESQLVQGRRTESAASYREALGILSGRELSTRAKAEAELALRRLLELSRFEPDASETLSTLRSWSAPAEDADPRVTSFATYALGRVILERSGDVDGARSAWSPLGFLESWRVIGSFDNERGGGFSTAYGPEREIDLSASYDGKKREVAWRKLPRRPLGGLVDLDALFLPNDECLAYALTFVRSDRSRKAALRLGSDEGYKLWVNGELVSSKDARRKAGFDQTAVGVRLREGWNSVLLKVAESTGSWELQARLTRPDGSPLEGVEEGDPGEDALGAIARTFGEAAARAAKRDGDDAPEREEIACRGGIEEDLRRGVEEDPTDARLRYLLGSLLLEKEAHDSAEHPDAEELRRAVALDSRPAIYHHALARSLRRDTEVAADRDDNEWRRALEDAVERGGALAAWELGRYYHRDFGNHARALGYVERAREIHPGLAEAHLLRGDVEDALGFPLADRRAVGRAMESAPEARAALIARARLLERDGLQEKSAELLERAFERDRLDDSVRWELVGQRLDQGRTEEARGLLLAHARVRPLSTAAEERLARIALALESPGEAALRLASALEIRPEDHELHQRLGEMEWEAGRRDAAFAAWERALELQPNLPDLRERLDYLRSSRPRFEDEFRRDLGPRIARALREPPAPEDGVPARILFSLAAVEVNRDGTAREFVEIAVQALNDRGVRAYDSYAAPYAAGEQVLEFKKARVHRKDGTVADARLSRHGGTRRSGAYSRGWVDLPALSPGDVVEVEYVREDVAQSFFGDYYGRIEYFRGTQPIDEKVFVLRVPEEREFHFHQRNMDLAPRVEKDPAGGKVTYTWTRRDIARVEQEPGMPPDREVFPRLEISTFESWDAFSRWYHNLIRKQFEPSPEILAKARELTSGTETELDRIRAIYNFIVTEIRYNAWEFGVHGFKPYNASTVFARRFGDCKDKATLMTVMLEAAGIESYPVLIYADPRRGEEDLSLPMVHHFNHCITHVPPAPGRPGLFLDGTANFHNLNELPSMDRGADVLVVREDEPGIVTIPWNSPGELATEEEWTVELGEDGNARIEIHLRARGDYAVYLRQMFEIAGKRRGELERIFGSRFAGAEVISERFSDLSDLDQPVSMTVELEVPRLARRTSEGPSLDIPEDFFGVGRNLATLGSLEEREFDVVLGTPRRSALRVVYELPEGISVESRPAEKDIQAPFGRFRLAFESADGRLVLERELEISASRAPLEDYERLRELGAQFERLKNEKIILERNR